MDLTCDDIENKPKPGTYELELCTCLRVIGFRESPCYDPEREVRERSECCSASFDRRWLHDVMIFGGDACDRFGDIGGDHFSTDDVRDRWSLPLA